MEISGFDLMRLFTLVEYQLGEKNKKKKTGEGREESLPGASKLPK